MASPDNSFTAAIDGFPSPLQAELYHTLQEGGVIPSAVAARWMDTLGVEIGELMMHLVPVAAAYARVPISAFPVGAVARGVLPVGPATGPGSLYLGANMEFEGLPLIFTVHAEQSAVNNAWLSGETGVLELAVSAPPCGHCRQFLCELTTAFRGLHVRLHAETARPFRDFLPDPFGPHEPGFQGELMEPQDHGLRIEGGDAVTQAALEAANASYAPYTRACAGVALIGLDGKIYPGRYTENAAYNPGLSPLPSALAFMQMNSAPRAPRNISAATLVEVPARISQKIVTDAVLRAVSPRTELKTLVTGKRSS